MWGDYGSGWGMGFGMINMNDMRRRGTSGGGAATLLASGVTLVVFAIMPLLAPAAAPPAGSAAEEKPRFASLEVEIWPEFDRRGAALVILTGELAADLALPATVSLRVPASSDPTAVAFATAPGSGLFNLEHERIYADAFTTLRFKTEHRLIHVEYYDRLAPDNPDRRFTYVWPGDVAVDRLSVQLQEPAAASNVAVKPGLGAAAKGPDGLLYRKADLGAFDAGTRVPVEISYTKTDPRTSSEILGLSKAAPIPAPATGSTVNSGSTVTSPQGLLIVAILAALLVGAGSFLLWWRLSRKASGAAQRGAGFCPQCGNRVASDDLFCSKCGAPVRKR